MRDKYSQNFTGDRILLFNMLIWITGRTEKHGALGMVSDLFPQKRDNILTNLNVSAPSAAAVLERADKPCKTVLAADCASNIRIDREIRQWDA